MISISEAGRILHVTTRTLKRWDQTNVLPTYRTLGNHRRNKQSDVEAFMGLKNFQEDNTKNVFIYIVTCFSARLYGARGGKKVKQILEALEQERQVERLENHNESDIV